MTQFSEDSGNRRARAEVRIALATHDDLPGIATCELLAFSSATSAFDRLLFPFNLPLLHSGVHPRYWPTYDSTIRGRGQNLRDGSIVFVAFAKNDRGAEEVVGMAKMTPPREMLESARKRKKWNERVLGDVIYPTVEKLRNVLWKDSDGMDQDFLRAFKKEQLAVRDRVDKEKQYFLLNLFYVHPSHQGKGVGSALLDHCCSLADAEGVPMMLESSEAGFKLYTSRGFVKVDELNVIYHGERVYMPCMVRQPVAPPPPPKTSEAADRGVHSDSGLGDDVEKA